jgi:hypothetical protein
MKRPTSSNRQTDDWRSCNRPPNCSSRRGPNRDVAVPKFRVKAVTQNLEDFREPTNNPENRQAAN